MTPPRAHEPSETTVIVTGAAGFVGSHLCDRLVAAGCDVLALDNLSTGHPSHLAQLEGNPRLHFHRHDIVEPLPRALMPLAMSATRIYNLACPASPAHYQRHPVATVLASTIGSWRLLDLAQHSGARLLQVSTSEVYGDPQVHPQPESYWGHVNPIGPRACYDEGKRSAEALCYAYAEERGVDVRVARLFNCYGPRLRAGDGRVVSNFIAQALAGKPLTVYGDGLQTRSFCFVSDTVAALLALMESAHAGPVNIGNPHEHTMIELAGLVLDLTGSASTLTHRPLPVDDPARRRPDIATARRVIGWEPQVTLRAGLEQTIEHFRKTAGDPAHEAEVPAATLRASVRPVHAGPAANDAHADADWALWAGAAAAQHRTAGGNGHAASPP